MGSGINFNYGGVHERHLGISNRLANLAALCSTEPLPALCIDAGTAVTFDFLDSDKNFLGGLIAPGPDLMVRALAEGTKLLPHIESTKSSTLLGTDTISAILSGCWLGGLGLVEGILRKLALGITGFSL